ncbi:uncharacterized protein LOC115575075 [Sparus aurata]|uniref:uncharacterized protein LOC115575075 n=1 Tax=Sparus aurata TaxID=8175 RepID=UPI0011C1194F|nr:uncharacterized protein LOC115575075 [Sparus aurata]XP_030262733.1 uncharacterized protein LOC115575075 [Sparus aurata]XP_030262735.1 uncharacterized protein LOC115575075 [Sparus aurata]XP_030262736.1 uncharacterized protein LOC115575075 [Sparus aurata]
MNSLMDQRLTHNRCRCQSKGKISSPRHLHQSTIDFGDTAPCYTTTHNQSYSGRSSDGRPLIFHLRDPSFPSQHRARLDLRTNTDPLQSHSQQVHEPEHVTARTDSKKENWARYCSGQAVREITNPQGPSEYWTTHRTEHTLPVTDGSPQLAGGRPTQWHHHNILTGEQRQTAGPGNPSRRSRDRLLWAARRWETDCCSLRLY